MKRNRRTKDELDQLVATAVEGSSAARKELLEELFESLEKKYARRRDLQLVSPSRTASDILHDTLVRAWENFANFPGTTFGELCGWAEGICRHTTLEARRNSRCRTSQERCESIARELRQRFNFDPDCAEPPYERLARQEVAARVYKCYSRLGNHEQAIIGLRLFEALSFPEIGKKQRRSSTSARQDYNRALERLRDLLFSDGDT